MNSSAARVDLLTGGDPDAAVAAPPWWAALVHGKYQDRGSTTLELFPEVDQA